MNDSEWKNEFAELLADVREQLRFAGELGLNGLETDFTAEIETSAEPQNTVSAKRNQQFAAKPFAPSERFVPQMPQKIVAPPKPSVPPTPTAFASRLEKLQSTKLSNFSQSVHESNKNEPRKTENAPDSVVAQNQNLPKKQGENKMEEVSLFGDLAPVAPVLPESNETPEDVRTDIGDCVRCPLYQGRTKIVHTDGNWKSRILFVGEAPGADEDASGKPFVGRAGQLLTKIIEAIGLKREEVLIGNVNRCRPPQNRTPTIQEARTCRQFLMREIAIARPEIIVVMGNTACQNLLDTKEGITKLRGKFQDYYGVKVMPTFHPAYLLRDPSKKRETWEDMKIVRDELARTAK